MSQNSERAVGDAPVVMLVEDDPLIRLVASDILADAGFRTIEACSADEALIMLQAKPDAVALVTDVQMPGSIDGFGLAHLVACRWPHTGIVIVSGRAVPGEGDLPPHALFLTKPYSPSALVSAVRKVTTRNVVIP